jgi:enoyl-CoA hydratase/carnithine racemase
MAIRCQFDADVARITLDAPERQNALGVAMWRDLRAAVETAGAREAVRCIVLRGAGGHFAAGADISEFPRERFDVESGRRYHLDLIAPALRALQCAPQPVIAAIEGSCVGGGLEIASVCDLRIGARGCRLGAPVGRLGFPLALPELAPLLRLAGPAMVSDLLLTGRLLETDEALSAGLLQRVVPPDALDAAVEEMIAAVRAGSPMAARLNKSNIRMLDAQGGTFTDAQLAESFAFFASDDYAEGIRAFLARRKPVFRGR